MSKGNKIRLRINTKYNLVTSQKNIRLHPSVKTRAQTFHPHFQHPVLHCYKIAWLYLEICSIFRHHLAHHLDNDQPEFLC